MHLMRWMRYKQSVKQSAFVVMQFITYRYIQYVHLCRLNAWRTLYCRRWDSFCNVSGQLAQLEYVFSELCLNNDDIPYDPFPKHRIHSSVRPRHSGNVVLICEQRSRSTNFFHGILFSSMRQSSSPNDCSAPREWRLRGWSSSSSSIASTSIERIECATAFSNFAMQLEPHGNLGLNAICTWQSASWSEQSWAKIFIKSISISFPSWNNRYGLFWNVLGIIWGFDLRFNRFPLGDTFNSR